MNPNAKTVCCLGLATGISASGLENVEDPPPVTAIELSSNVVKLAKQYFGDETDGFFDRSGNEVIVEDARTYVAAATDQFDLIVGDLYRPYGTGEGRLFSIEHFRNIRRALTHDGIYCQWLPVYQLDEENWRTIAATFQKAFPETLVLYGDPNVNYPVIGLVGRKNDAKWEMSELSARFDEIPAETLKRDPQLKIVKEFVVGVLKQDGLSDQRINTLDNLQVEISAGNFWVLKDLRKNRKQRYESEFLSGKHLVQFNERLETWVEPVFPATEFQKLNNRFRRQTTKPAKKQTTKRK